MAGRHGSAGDGSTPAAHHDYSARASDELDFGRRHDESTAFHSRPRPPPQLNNELYTIESRAEPPDPDQLRRALEMATSPPPGESSLRSPPREPLRYGPRRSFVSFVEDAAPPYSRAKPAGAFSSA